MKIAALYDIHGNLPALEAVLDEVRQTEVALVMMGGDVLPGPMAKEALRCLLELEIPVQFIRGNGDRAVLERMRGEERDKLPEAAREAIRWAAEQLTPEDEQVLASWPDTVRLPIEGLGDVLFCHATPRNDTEVFTRLTAEDRLLPVFRETNAEIVICGHTHMQFDRMMGDVRVVNAGSVGMPFGAPGAYWLLLLGPEVELRRTAYDLEKAAGRVRRTTYPQAEEFAAKNVLRPPSEEEMLAVFGKAELN